MSRGRLEQGLPTISAKLRDNHQSPALATFHTDGRGGLVGLRRFVGLPAHLFHPPLEVSGSEDCPKFVVELCGFLPEREENEAEIGFVVGFREVLAPLPTKRDTKV